MTCEIRRELQTRQYISQIGEYVVCIFQNKSHKGEILATYGEIN